MKIISTKKYEYLNYMIKQLREERNELAKQNAELKKQLIYQKTYTCTFKERINKLYWHNMQCPTHEPDVIFPNTDERGLGEQEVPVNFPDLW